MRVEAQAIGIEAVEALKAHMGLKGDYWLDVAYFQSTGMAFIVPSTQKQSTREEQPRDRENMN